LSIYCGHFGVNDKKYERIGYRRCSNKTSLYDIRDYTDAELNR